MKFEDAVPIVEGKLYAWAVWRREYPDAPISSVYEAHEGRNETRNTTSPQERWVLRHALELRDASIIERTIQRMSEDQRQLIWMRYVERMHLRVIAEKLHVSVPQVYRIKDQALSLLAYEFGLLNGDAA